MVILKVRITAVSSGGDYESLSEFITFVNGSANGSEVCVSVTVNSDSQVECEEDFAVSLSLLTSGASLGLGNSNCVVTLLDSNSMYNTVHIYVA